jgi:hypothetical protein
MLTVEEAQAALTVFHAFFLAERPDIRIIPSAKLRSLADDDPLGWERHLREKVVSRFGATLLPLPDSWQQSRFVQALKLSPRYMGAGVREAASELFGSPAFVASVGLSVAVYFAAWLAPEPLFSKAFVVTLTAALALTVGMFELANVALACLRLYQAAEAARTQKELEAAAERFGKRMGGTGLRVLVMVASAGVAKGMPTAPAGGLGALLGAPRYAVAGGLAVGEAATAHVVAGSNLILSGVATGELAAQLCRGLAVCATMDDSVRTSASGTALSARYGPAHTRKNPAHNEAIERELAARERAGHVDLRKNKAQVDSKGDPVFDGEAAGGPHFRRPDAASLRPDGVRQNTNYVSNARDLKRELEAFEAMRRADLQAIHELYLLDGTLVRRYVPPGASYP